ncbi:MAG: SNF2-related protein [Spirochaetota bacterium]
MGRIKLKIEPNYKEKLAAFPYQKNAKDEICDLEYAAIFHEQGLGKTKIAIDLILYWFEKKIIDTVFIVVKKSLLKNWEKELSFHTYLHPKILSQNKHSNYYVFNSPAKVILCNYEVIKSEIERIDLFNKTRPVGIILDESVKLKNPKSSLTKSFFKIAPTFARRVIMTGTPIANRPYDLWSQIWFLDQGKSLGDIFSKFKKNLDLSNSLYDDEDKKNNFEIKLKNIFNLISSFSVRETKTSGIIVLPKKEYKRIITHWEPHQQEIYNKIKMEVKYY